MLRKTSIEFARHFFYLVGLFYSNAAKPVYRSVFLMRKNLLITQTPNAQKLSACCYGIILLTKIYSIDLFFIFTQ